MFRQRFALWYFRRGALRLWDLDGRSAFVGLQILETKLKLLDLTIQLLRFAAELHAAKLADEQLQMFDLGGARSQCRFLRIHSLL
ncbi:hypothetical protein DM39_4133 [Burkholderia cenocepacia]|uniref:Uncharacterized protein n=1 Tax=Burkholderia cenocepacia TaxID=95486 RepID=A0AAN0RYQ8_9BURK|nr:hypothetical protein DM39_4133 [Burkholderia cenocepacia]